MVIGVEISLKAVIELFSKHEKKDFNKEKASNSSDDDEIEIKESLKNGLNPDLINLGSS